MSENPELDYFKNESVSDVIFKVEGQSLPAMKAILSLKSKVFRAMFSGDFRESKDKEVVIEDTTYKAFEIFIRFLYCEDLVLKNIKDYELFEELCKLCDRYDVSRLMDRIIDELYEWSESIVHCRPKFREVWTEMQSISRIAFEYKIKKLMDIVIEFTADYWYYIKEEDQEILTQMNASTDGRLFNFIIEWYKDSKCEKCGEINHVPSNISLFYCLNCAERNYPFFDTT